MYRKHGGESENNKMKMCTIMATKVDLRSVHLTSVIVFTLHSIINLINILMIQSSFMVKNLKRFILYMFISFISHSNLLYSHHMSRNTPHCVI
jgi:hypothetical protein